MFNALERPSSTTASESAYGISIRHLRTTGCTLAYATATDFVDGRAGSAMVGGAWHSWLGFWREWLGRAHLSGMYPSLLHNRGFDACSTCSLHLHRKCTALNRLVFRVKCSTASFSKGAKETMVSDARNRTKCGRSRSLRFVMHRRCLGTK